MRRHSLARSPKRVSSVPVVGFDEAPDGLPRLRGREVVLRETPPVKLRQLDAEPGGAVQYGH